MTAPMWLPRGTAAAVERRLTPQPERRLPADPVEFAHEAGVHLWSKQREIARSVVENRETLVPSCHQAGKTFLAATIGAWWIAGAPAGERWLVTSAPSERQIRALLWRELARAHHRHGLQGSIAGVQWHVGPAGGRTMVGIGMKPQDYTDSEQAMQRFQGFHAPEGVLVILDEATGIPSWLWTAVDTITGGDVDRVIAIGNPDDPSSAFAKRCDASTGSTRAPGQRYVTRLGAHVIPIDAFATPNLTGEPCPEYVRKQLLSASTVARWGEQWGTDNPLYVSKVRGLFPDRSTHNVIGPNLIRRAWVNDFAGAEMGCYGLDVARSVHGDESALYRDRGGVIRAIDTWRNPDLTRTAEHVFRLTSRVPAIPIVVDVAGVGAGAFDILRRGMVGELGEVGRARTVIPFTASGNARQPRDYDTRRTEIWWAARQELEAGLWDLDEEDDELAAQLQAPRWRVDGRGRIHVETKEELASRGVSSPDRADAALMARFGAPRVGLLAGYANGNGKAKRNGRSAISDVMRRKM
jgi:hypothetical protein